MFVYGFSPGSLLDKIKFVAFLERGCFIVALEFTTYAWKLPPLSIKLMTLSPAPIDPDTCWGGLCSWTFQFSIEMCMYISLRIQAPCQMMIGVYNHLLSKVFRFHYHSQKVIGSLGHIQIYTYIYTEYEKIMKIYISSHPVQLTFQIAPDLSMLQKSDIRHLQLNWWPVGHQKYQYWKWVVKVFFFKGHKTVGSISEFHIFPY